MEGGLASTGSKKLVRKEDRGREGRQKERGGRRVGKQEEIRNWWEKKREEEEEDKQRGEECGLVK